MLASAERVERLCAESYASLYESDDAILAALGGVWRRVAELAALDPQFQPYLEARDGIKSQLEDLARFLRSYADGIEASPARLQQVEDRLALLERLKRKYGPTLATSSRDATRCGANWAISTRGDERHRRPRAATLPTARARVPGRGRDAVDASAARRRRDFATAARSAAGGPGDGAHAVRGPVRPSTLPESAWSGRGIDAAEFFVSPNPGEDLRPLARIVSGGELSRIMLAIKTLTATSRHGLQRRGRPAAERLGAGLIFDEVDAGIGGRVADVVGRKLRALARRFRCCASRTCRRLPRTPTRTSRSRSGSTAAERGRRVAGSTTAAGSRSSHACSAAKR